MAVKILLKEKEIKKDNSDILIIILKNKKYNDYNILGKKMLDWVVDNINKNYIVIDYACGDILTAIKPYINNVGYTIVLNDNIPLITTATFNNLVDYVIYKSPNACKFSGGYAFKNEYINNTQSVFYDSVYMHNQEDFYLVENKRQLTEVRKILQERIFDYHLLNGVDILDIRNVTIDANVEIGNNVTLYKGNALKGDSVIGESCILKENNVIENSVLGEGCAISGSTISNSVLGDNVYVLAYCNIDNCKIGNNVVIKSGVCLSNVLVKDNKIIEKTISN